MRLARLLLPLLLGTIASAAAPQRPSIIIILADDMGYGDLGCYGSPNIETPNIDRMAGEGLRLTSFYAAPVCSPSRSQIMTGCYATRVSNARNPFPSSPWGLNPREITIAEVLKGAGYATFCIGKWHLGDAPEFLPTSQGFDHYFGVPFSNDMWRFHPLMAPRPNEDPLLRDQRIRAAYTGYRDAAGTVHPPASADELQAIRNDPAHPLPGAYWPAGLLDNDLPLMRDERVVELNPDQHQLTTRYTEAAVQFIHENRDHPFFLYLAMHMPHVPLFVSDKFAGKSPRGLYGDCVMEVDWGVGQVLNQLKKDRIDEHTIVVFMSDNGPWLDYGVDGGSAGPLRGGKVSTWEGGERVPAIFRWPGRIPANVRSNAVVANIDLLPTLSGLAGGTLPQDRVIDGRDAWPVLSGAAAQLPHRYFQFLAGSKPGQVNYHGIRDEQWKLVVEVSPDGRVVGRELYDLGADPGESFNRIQQQPEIAARLRDAGQQFYDELAAHVRPMGTTTYFKDKRSR